MPLLAIIPTKRISAINQTGLVRSVLIYPSPSPQSAMIYSASASKDSNGDNHLP